MEWSPQHQPSWLCFCLVASRWRWTAAAGCSVWWSRRPAQSTWTLAAWRWGAPWRRAATWCCPPPSCQVFRDASSSVSSPTLPSGSGNQSRSGRTLWCNTITWHPAVLWLHQFHFPVGSDPLMKSISSFVFAGSWWRICHLHLCCSVFYLSPPLSPQSTCTGLQGSASQSKQVLRIKRKKQNKKKTILNRVYIHC